MSGEDLRNILIIVQLIVTVVMAVFMAVLNAKAKKIDTLEGELKRSTERVIGEQLSSIENRVSVQSVELRTRVSTIEARLLAGDATLKKLGDRDHDLEIKVLNAISDLKDVVATKDDLDRLRREVLKDHG